jgi:pyridoxamine 5'-phosphate oxidase
MKEKTGMTATQFIIELERLIEDAKTAVLATVDSEGKPQMRWMTPAILKDRSNSIYAVTSLDFPKRSQLQEHPEVQWMFQSKSLDRIAYVSGRSNLIENPSMRAEVLEEIGGKLGVFWKQKADSASLVVIETVIEEGRFFLPMKGEYGTVSFV